jgi:hypothetical protein
MVYKNFAKIHDPGNAEKNHENTLNMNKSKNAHLAKAQLYRWYQLYEREMNEKRIENQMQILADDVVIKSAAGEMRGKENYPARLSVYEGWQNAHHVQTVEVAETKNGLLNMEADIRYQNIQPDGQKKTYTIHYSTLLTKSSEILPLFSSIEIKPTGETKDEFEDAYPVNRIKSLMHYWLALMENLDGDFLPFKELLTDNFLLNFSTASEINSIEKLHARLNGTPKSLLQSSHCPEKFSVKKIMENEYEMTVEFDWKGVGKDGNKMTARTRHVWYIIDNLNDRFAKIKRADVTQIEALKVKE